MTPLSIDRSCPRCHQSGKVVLEGLQLRCLNQSCSFVTRFDCPICQGDLHDPTLTGDGFACGKCKSTIAFKKVKYLIENGMYVDYDQRCVICHGPTIHRKEMNLSHRCFFFPKCSGQGDLFGVTKDSMVFLDFETTGLEAGKDNIIEIGALKIDEEGYEHVFQTFVKPVVPVSDVITKITGITPDMVENAPELGPSLQKLMAFIGTAKIIAHNAEFDLPWLCTALIRHAIPKPGNEVICTLVWARQNQEPHCSLSALSKKYSLSHANAHRALADAAATKELYFIFENYRKAPAPIRLLHEYWEMSEKITARYATHSQP